MNLPGLKAGASSREDRGRPRRPLFSAARRAPDPPFLRTGVSPPGQRSRRALTIMMLRIMFAPGSCSEAGTDERPERCRNEATASLIRPKLIRPKPRGIHEIKKKRKGENRICVIAATERSFPHPVRDIVRDARSGLTSLRSVKRVAGPCSKAAAMTPSTKTAEAKAGRRQKNILLMTARNAGRPCRGRSG